MNETLFSSPPVRGEERNNDISVHPELLHVWNSYTCGESGKAISTWTSQDEGEAHGGNGAGLEEASHQQAVNHSPSALEATWFGDLGTRVSHLLIVSALNNCLFISQSRVKSPLTSGTFFISFLALIYCRQFIFLSVPFAATLLIACCSKFSCLSLLFYSVTRKHSFKRNMWETVLERVQKNREFNGGSEGLPWCISGATEGQYKKREVEGTLGNLWVSCFMMHVSVYFTCHLCPVGLGKERPGFLSMEFIRGRGKHKKISPFSSINHYLPLRQWFKSESNCLVSIPSSQESRAESGSLRREAVTLMNSPTLGDLQVQRKLQQPMGAVAQLQWDPHISWLRGSGYVNQIHFITLQWEAALSTGRLVLVWQSHLLPVGGPIKGCQNTWKLWTNPWKQNYKFRK